MHHQEIHPSYNQGDFRAWEIKLKINKNNKKKITWLGNLFFMTWQMKVYLRISCNP